MSEYSEPDRPQTEFISRDRNLSQINQSNNKTQYKSNIDTRMSGASNEQNKSGISSFSKPLNLQHHSASPSEISTNIAEQRRATQKSKKSNNIQLSFTANGNFNAVYERLDAIMKEG